MERRDMKRGLEVLYTAKTSARKKVWGNGRKLVVATYDWARVRLMDPADYMQLTENRAAQRRLGYYFPAGYEGDTRVDIEDFPNICCALQYVEPFPPSIKEQVSAFLLKGLAINFAGKGVVGSSPG